MISWYEIGFCKYAEYVDFTKLFISSNFAI